MPTNFPLPFTVFEEYMLLENRKSYPMSIYVQLRFRGTLHRPSFEQAFAEALHRHPLLRSKISRQRSVLGRLKWKWIASGLNELPLKWIEGKTTPPRAPYIDLETSHSMQAWVSDSETSPEISLHLHHAAADGAGIFTFIRDLLLGYSNRRGDSDTLRLLPPIDSDKLKDRGNFGLNFWGILKRVPDQLTGSIWGIRFAAHQPAPLIQVDRGEKLEDLSNDYRLIITRSVSPETTRAYRASSKNKGKKLNNQIVTDVLTSIPKWRIQESITQCDDWIRVCIPMNERSDEDTKISACNIVSLAFLDRRPSECKDSADLLRSVEKQMGILKRKRLGLMVILSLLGGRYLPGAWHQITNPRKCRSTCVLSNLGEPLAQLQLPTESAKYIVGDVVLDGMEVVAPIRPLTQAALVVFTYANQLHITAHFDPNYFTYEQAENLLTIIFDTITNSSGIT